jgi:hypothetical protein
MVTVARWREDDNGKPFDVERVETDDLISAFILAAQASDEPAPAPTEADPE